MSIRVLDPRLDPEGEAPHMAPPLASLDGATVGLLDNAKIGTERFFDHLEAMLRAKNGIREVIRRRKPDSHDLFRLVSGPVAAWEVRGPKGE